ncbi:MAG: glycoside hydrolase family 15 protein, partial [Chloroflexota bacterium]
RIVPRLESRGANSVVCQTGLDLFHLRSDLPLNADGADLLQRFTLRPGDRHYFGLAFSQDAPSVYPSLNDDAEEIIDMTLDFWRNWSEHCSYTGPYSEAVLRSALVLKLMAFAPSGAIVAAPTTSLPEEIGGVRNWDYRYCWLRDASFTVRALYSLGYYVEGDAFIQWMLHATRLTHPALQVMYNLYGETHLPERELDHLEGYCGSRPVRIGNGAISQFQIDLYGEVMAALEHYYNITGTLDSDTRNLLIGAADYVARRWKEPDHGIWELRSGKAQHVHGKVMAWRALDCAARIARRSGIANVADSWDRVKEEIRVEILTRGYNQRLGSFVRVFGGQDVDGSLLTLPLVGFINGADPRMNSTIDVVQRQLGVGEFIYRYRGIDDGLPGQEGAFLTCSFWLVGNLALSGRVRDAYRTFEALLSRANDLGLFPEEMDPKTGRFLGNYPQALTHIALINAALTLQQAEA